jgi:MOSC domain-containing protein YiiM
MSRPLHRTLGELESGLEEILRSSPGTGALEMIARRPAVGEREVLDVAELDTDSGLVGDGWADRPSSRSATGGPHPGMQLTLMNSRVIDLIAGERERWALAGDQLYVDLDLRAASLPPGTQLTIGEAMVEITAEPHTGCGKFIERFGVDAMRFVNSSRGRELGLRGVNARVVTAGRVSVGDTVRRVLVGQWLGE